MYDFVTTAVNEEMKKFLENVEKEFKIKNFRQLNNLRKKILLLSIESKKNILHCVDFSEEYVLYDNLLISKKHNVVMYRLGENNTKNKLSNLDCIKCKELNLEFAF